MILLVLLESLSYLGDMQFGIAPVVVGALISLAGTGAQAGIDANTKKKLAKLSAAEAAALETAMKSEKDAARRQQLLIDAAEKADKKSRTNIIVGIGAIIAATFAAFYLLRKKK